MALLHDRYELTRPLGEGGAGQTWLATDQRGGRSVTIKELRTPVNVTNQALLERETRLLSQLDHPQIPKFIEAFIEPVRLVPRLHLVLEFIPGVPLDQEIASRRFSQVEARATIQDLLGILAYLHGLAPPVLHRDVKPSNVIRRPDGSLALIDFGLATDAIDRTFLHTMAVGTLGYQAPEQIAGDPVPASDVYSAAVLAFELLTRTRPREVLATAGLRWEGRARHLDAHWQRWLAKALALQPAQRFADAGEALAALRERAVQMAAHPPRSPETRPSQARGPSARPAVPAPERSSRPTRRSALRSPVAGFGRQMLFVGLGALAVGAGVVGLAIWRGDQPPVAAAPPIARLPPDAPRSVERPAPDAPGPADRALAERAELAERPALERTGPTLLDFAQRSALDAETRAAAPSAACRRGDGAACTRAALALIDASLHRDVRAANHDRAAELLEAGCRSGHGEACERLGRLVLASEPARSAWALGEACAHDRQGTCARFFEVTRGLPDAQRDEIAASVLGTASEACERLGAQAWSTATQARCAVALQWHALGLSGRPDPAAAEALVDRACAAGAVELCEGRGLDAFRP